MLNQKPVLRLRIANDNVVVGYEEYICNFTLRAEGLTGARCAEDQTIWILQELSIHHDEVVG